MLEFSAKAGAKDSQMRGIQRPLKLNGKSEWGRKREGDTGLEQKEHHQLQQEMRKGIQEWENPIPWV